MKAERKFVLSLIGLAACYFLISRGQWALALQAAAVTAFFMKKQ